MAFSHSSREGRMEAETSMDSSATLEMQDDHLRLFEREAVTARHQATRRHIYLSANAFDTEAARTSG